MEAIKIASPAEAMQRLRRAASAKGHNFVYNESGENPSCHYFETDDKQTLNDGADPADVKPGCIIGQMLADAGLDPVAEPEVVKAIEGQDVKTLAGGNSYYNRSGKPVLIEAPPVVVEILAQAQRAQDDGESWGEALRVALAVETGYHLARA